jgi:hypothetical protein
MKEVFKSGSMLFFRTIIINIMCFFVVFSITAFALAAFAQEKGYVAYGTASGSGVSKKLYTHYNSDGEDTKLAEYEAKGYTVTKRGIRELSTGANVAVLLIGQAFSLGILISFVYPSLWKQGASDHNLANFQHEKADPLKGLKIGLTANAPYVLYFLFLVVTMNGISKTTTVALYKLVNTSFFPIIELIAGNTANFSDLSAIKIILLAFLHTVIPFIAFLGYYLGFKDYAISERLIYQKSGAKKDAL